MLGAITASWFGSVTQAHADGVQLSSGGATAAFCEAVRDFTFEGVGFRINMDFPGLPFFHDGNNDGIADSLQLDHARLPSLASGLEALANLAPPDLQAGLRTIATDVRALASQPAPTTAAQSSQQVKRIEEVASVSQRSLRAKNCRAIIDAASEADAKAEAKAAKAKAAEAKVAKYYDGSSADTAPGLAGILLWLAFLVLSLLIVVVRMIHMRSPLQLNEAGTAFVGRYSRWNVSSTTGIVTSAARHTETYGSSSVSTNASGGVSGGGHVTTSVHDQLQLLDAAGQLHEISVTDYSMNVARGNVLTWAVASDGNRMVNLAYRNHSTRSHYLVNAALPTIQKPSRGLSSLVVKIAKVVACLGVVGIPFVVADVYFSKRARDGFRLAPLWAHAEPDAERLTSGPLSLGIEPA